jgi:long-subunit acyl-CoA synthetase (AMP-forming)
MSVTESSTAEGQSPDIRTVNELFLRVARSKRPDAMLYQDETGAWQEISSAEVYRRVRALARPLWFGALGAGTALRS